MDFIGVVNFYPQLTEHGFVKITFFFSLTFNVQAVYALLLTFDCFESVFV